MPLPYIAFHLLLSLVCLAITLRIPRGSRTGIGLGLVLLAALIAGFAIERRQTWAWAALRFSGSGLVFLTNLSIEGAVVLLAILWRSASDRKARLRASILACLLLIAALWSYAWYFEPLPPYLTGIMNAIGYCPQTSQDSCSAASAVTLLAQYHIPATEAEMADLCLTRAGQGTSPLGLYRGLTLKAASWGFRPRLLVLGGPKGLRKSACPCILSVGLKSGCPPAINDRMLSYGWEPGRQHTVVVLDADSAGKWLDVADPSYGREHWPTDDLKYLWDGYALILAPL